MRKISLNRQSHPSIARHYGLNSKKNSLAVNPVAQWTKGGISTSRQWPPKKEQATLPKRCACNSRREIGDRSASQKSGALTPRNVVNEQDLSSTLTRFTSHKAETHHYRRHKESAEATGHSRQSRESRTENLWSIQDSKEARKR